MCKINKWILINFFFFSFLSSGGTTFFIGRTVQTAGGFSCGFPWNRSFRKVNKHSTVSILYSQARVLELMKQLQCTMQKNPGKNNICCNSGELPFKQHEKTLDNFSWALGMMVEWVINKAVQYGFIPSFSTFFWSKRMISWVTFSTCQIHFVIYVLWTFLLTRQHWVVTFWIPTQLKMGMKKSCSRKMHIFFRFFSDFRGFTAYVFKKELMGPFRSQPGGLLLCLCSRRYCWKTTKSWDGLKTWDICKVFCCKYVYWKLTWQWKSPHFQ